MKINNDAITFFTTPWEISKNKCTNSLIEKVGITALAIIATIALGIVIPLITCWVIRCLKSKSQLETSELDTPKFKKLVSELSTNGIEDYSKQVKVDRMVRSADYDVLDTPKFKVLVTGLLTNGNGDYSKQAKVGRMLRSAGYDVKVLSPSPNAKKTFTNFMSEKHLLDNKAEDILAFNPDLVIHTPVDCKEGELYAQTLEIPVLAIDEYGYELVAPLKERNNFIRLTSGMEGLGIILDSPYKERYADPKEHLKNLPPIYQKAIYGENFETFRQENDFFFGYAYHRFNLASFMMGIAHQRFIENDQRALQKKLSFFFMGDDFVFSPDSQYHGSFKKECYPIFAKLNVKSILVKTIDKTTGEIRSNKILFDENPNGREIEVVSARIENKYVYPLIHAADETYSTGDESLAEVYSCGKVPLLYESLDHKIRLRKMQLHEIFHAYPEYKHFNENVRNMRFKSQSYLEISDLLTAKKDPKVQQSLADHLSTVCEKWNFKKNLLQKVETYARAAFQKKKMPLIIVDDFRSWPIGERFCYPSNLLSLVYINSVSGKIELNPNGSNKEIYNQWKNYTFKVNEVGPITVLEIKKD